MEIRLAKNEEFEEIWPILCEASRKGDTYAFSPDTTKEEGLRIWMDTPKAT